MTSLKLRVVLCRIRPFPTLISKDEITCVTTTLNFWATERFRVGSLYCLKWFPPKKLGEGCSLRVVQPFHFLKSLSERVEFNMTSLKLGVILCRIRPFPTLISKNEIACVLTSLKFLATERGGLSLNEKLISDFTFRI